uniref:Conotoxin n=1 Tax=Conus betulinus TaxID=89764 RepID=A0A142C1D8_CONBE|nr:conotoxin [Conus betulinus]
MAATVVGSTPLEEPDLSRMERYGSRSCCINLTYQCLQGFPGQEHLHYTLCHHDAAAPCGFDSDLGCCNGYMYCIGMFVEQHGLEDTHNHCKTRLCNPNRR